MILNKFKFLSLLSLIFARGVECAAELISLIIFPFPVFDNFGYEIL